MRNVIYDVFRKLIGARFQLHTSHTGIWKDVLEEEQGFSDSPAI
jgi:hypothetical protein